MGRGGLSYRKSSQGSFEGTLRETGAKLFTDQKYFNSLTTSMTSLL